MRKLIILGAAALLAPARSLGVAQATPLFAGRVATGGTVEQAMPDQGVLKARSASAALWVENRGYHYGLGPP